MIKNHKKLTNREKILRVLRRRLTPLSTKEIALKAKIPHSSARRELAALYPTYMVDRMGMEHGNQYWRIGIAA